MLFNSPEAEFKPPVTPLAFFDLDLTITDTDTDWLWAKWRAAHSLKGWVELAIFTPMYRTYRRGTLDVKSLIWYQRWRVGKIDPMVLRAQALRFFIEKGEGHIFREAIRLIQAQKEMGSRVVMITAQQDIIASPFAQRLGMDDLVASHLTILNGKFGPPVTPYCYREGKLYWAMKYAEGLKLNLEECAFYSDSINDLPLLKAVGRPVVVNPDPILRIEAHKLRWPTIFYAEQS